VGHPCFLSAPLRWVSITLGYSLVHLTNGERAKIFQLAGVPGLSMVKIQYEGESEASVVKRKGAILEVSNDAVLDRVPERYLETALPKQSGKAVFWFHALLARVESFSSIPAIMFQVYASISTCS
jgi:hypothetical protein